jgi:hypothetical protein
MTLPSGRLSYRDWKKQLNESITHGSRILITENNELRKYSGKNWTDRLFYYVNDHNAPPPPQPGIYTVEIFKENKHQTVALSKLAELEAEGRIVKKADKIEKKAVGTYVGDDERGFGKYEYEDGISCTVIVDTLTILYNPKDEITYVGGWGGEYDPHERKKRIRWRIYPSDNFLLNYDRLAFEDIDFYLHSRVDRKNYLESMPLLKRLKKQLALELDNEKLFVEFVVGRNTANLPDLSEQEIRQRVVDSIAWWKFKNQFKRAITKDDTLALRMIERRITSKNYSKLKPLQDE